MKKLWESLPTEAKVAIIAPVLMAWAALVIGMALLVVVMLFKAAGLS